MKSISYPNKIVLYWKLPDNFEKGNSYKVYEGEKLIAETESCNFSYVGLKELTEYTFKVTMADKSGNESLVGTLTAETLKEKKRIDVTKSPYNAVGDGKTLNTEALQKALDDVKADEYIYFPEGTFLSGGLRVHSNTEIYIEKGATLKGSAKSKDYEPKVKTRFEGTEMECYSSLLNIGVLDREKGVTCENVRIWGEGAILGGGKELSDETIERESILLKDYMDVHKEEVESCERVTTIPGRRRGRLITVLCAKNVLISGLTMGYAASWNVHIIYSQDVITHNCVINSHGVWNGDGWDPDSSKNCTIFATEFSTGDDAIAIKSGKNPEGNIVNIPCENVYVFDCFSKEGHAISLGSEMSGGLNNIKIWNCDFRNTSSGINVKGTEKRGAYVKNIDIRNCRFARVRFGAVWFNNDGIGAECPPVFENFYFENIELTGDMLTEDGTYYHTTAIAINGFNESGYEVKNVKFKNLTINSRKDSLNQTICLNRCRNITFENISCN